jgi:hypothetical protein
MALDPIVAFTQIEQAVANHAAQANSAMADLAQAAAGYLSKAITGTVTLSLDESQNDWIDLTGTPAGASDISLHASVNKRTFFRNLTTSGQVIRVRIGSGTFFPVPAEGVVVLLSSTQALTLHADTAPQPLGTAAAIGTSQQLAREDHIHPAPFTPILFNLEPVTLTDLPAALTEFNGQTHRRRRHDMTRVTRARVVAQVETAGAAGSDVRIQYSTDEMAWDYLDHAAGPSAGLDNTGVETDGYVNLHANAKADVFLRLVTIGGDGAADPVVGAVELQLQ